MSKSYLIIFLILFNVLPVSAQRKKNKANTPVSDESNTGPNVSLEGLKFRCIGPALTSGRIADFAVNEHSPSEYYVAVASGGVWKTINNGTTWDPIFDTQGSYSIGCVTLDPTNPEVVWVGTGENNNQRSVGFGDGIYRSEDGGKSWEHMGLKDSEHIGMISIHPDNPLIIYVAAYGPVWSSGGDRGIYKSTNGGETWERILFVSEHTGFSEVKFDPRDPEVLYATAHQRRRHVYTYIGGGPESAVYKSTDGGANWKKIMNGFPEVDLGRIGLAISPVNPDYVYAIVEAADGKSGFYRSKNRGAKWEKMSDYTTSGNYYQELFCDPIDLNRVYAMDVWLQVTDDGGKTFKMLGEKFKHVDNHAMWINPKNTDNYLVGCDGGIYESFDRGENWNYKANLPITQFYKVSVDNEEPFYNVYGGTQDNFSIGGPSRTTNDAGITNSDWYITNGGDGFESQVDPTNPDIVYAQSQYGWLVRYDRKSGEMLGIKPMEREGEDAYRWNWDAPLMLSLHSPTRLYFAANKVFRSDDRGNTWEVISDDLTRQVDRNKIPVMGKVWSMDAVSKNNSTSIYGNIVSLDESPLQEGLIYAGTDDGLVNVTENGGSYWRKVSSFPGVPSKTYVNSIVTSLHNRNTVYAAFNNHKNGDFKPYLLKSTDAGKSWVSIASNLPERGSVYSIAEDHIDPDLLFAGTEFGIFFSNNGGSSWTQLKTGIPTVGVRDIAIQRRENDLVLATFGRGFYILDDYSPLRYVKKGVIDKEAHIFDIRPSWMFVTSKPLGLRGNSFQGSSYYAAENPPLGAEVTYFLKEDVKTMKDIRTDKEKKLKKSGENITYPTFDEMRAEDDEEKAKLLFTIRNEKDKIIRIIETEPKAGVNRITWNFRYPSSGPVNLLKPEFDNPFSDPDIGPMAIPGTYNISMSLLSEGKTMELVSPVQFEIRLLNNTTLPAEDKEALLTFQHEVSELYRVVAGISKVLEEMRNKIKHMKVAIRETEGTDPTLLERISMLDKELIDIDRKINGDKSLSKRNFETPPSISDRALTIMGRLWATSSAPTNTQRESYKTAKNEFQIVYTRMKALHNTEIRDIEKQLEIIKAPWTPGRFPVWE